MGGRGGYPPPHMSSSFCPGATLKEGAAARDPAPAMFMSGYLWGGVGVRGGWGSAAPVRRLALLLGECGSSLEGAVGTRNMGVTWVTERLGSGGRERSDEVGVSRDSRVRQRLAAIVGGERGPIHSHLQASASTGQHCRAAVAPPPHLPLPGNLRGGRAVRGLTSASSVWVLRLRAESARQRSARQETPAKAALVKDPFASPPRSGDVFTISGSSWGVYEESKSLELFQLPRVRWSYIRSVLMATYVYIWARLVSSRFTPDLKFPKSTKSSSGIDETGVSLSLATLSRNGEARPAGPLAGASGGRP